MPQVTILGIVGSPRRNSNTEVMVREALNGAEETGSVATDVLLMAGKKINPCTSCFICKQKKDFCVFRFKDDMQEYYEKYLAADGVIIGSPVYHLSVTGILKNAIDRLGQGLLSKYRDTGLPWFCKAAGVITQGATIYGGQEYTLQFMVDHLIIMNNLVVSPDGLNALGVAGSLQDSPDRTPGVIGQYDPKALQRSKRLGKRVAEIAKIIKAGAEALQNELPEEYRKNILHRQEFAQAALSDKPRPKTPGIS